MIQPVNRHSTNSLLSLPPVTTAKKLVLDTNIVLDWLAFSNRQLDCLAEAVRRKQVVLYTYGPALDELHRVLSYAELKLDANRQASLLDEYRRNSCLAELPMGFGLDNLLLPVGFPRCKDADDDHFLALALHVHADALVTRDKAVLALRKRAKKFGVTIINVQQLPAILHTAE